MVSYDEKVFLAMMAWWERYADRSMERVEFTVWLLNSPFDLNPEILLIFYQKLSLDVRSMAACFMAASVHATSSHRCRWDQLQGCKSLAMRNGSSDVEMAWDGSVSKLLPSNGTVWTVCHFCFWSRSCLPTNSSTGYNSAISACSKAWGLNILMYS